MKISLRILHVSILFSFAVLTSSAQDILLLTEDFENGAGEFTLNDGSLGSNTGDNLWTVNNDYDGAPDYPNTTDQNNTNGGTIGFAPYSNYLHIFDQTSGINNANYDPTSVSDRFAYMTFGLCTYGMEDVHFSFFYLAYGPRVLLTNAFNTLGFSCFFGFNRTEKGNSKAVFFKTRRQDKIVIRNKGTNFSFALHHNPQRRRLHSSG